MLERNADKFTSGSVRCEVGTRPESLWRSYTLTGRVQDLAWNGFGQCTENVGRGLVQAV